MSPERRAWSGKALIKNPNEEGADQPHTVVARERDDGSIIVRIRGIGTGHIRVDEDGHFRNQPFASHGSTPGTPDILEVSGHTESMGREVHGRFRARRNGTPVTEGTFEVTQRKGPTKT